jgi:hypothetical protein
MQACAVRSRLVHDAWMQAARSGDVTTKTHNESQIMSKTAGWVGALFALLLAATSQASSLLGYDPKADPFEQYHEAIAAAKAQDKLVLIIAGGDWCRWCHALERFVSNDPEVAAQLDDTFVVMKVYVGLDNYNDFFFSQLPPAKGAPHFWVISPEKEVLASLSTGGFEAGKAGYDKAAFLSFIDEWRMRRHAPEARLAASH